MRWFFLGTVLFFALLYWQIEEQKSNIYSAGSFTERESLDFTGFFADEQQLFLCSLSKGPELWLSRVFMEAFINLSKDTPLVDFLFYRLHYLPLDRQRQLQETAFIISTSTDNGKAYLTWIGALSEQEKLLRLLPEEDRLDILISEHSAIKKLQVQEQSFFIQRYNSYLIVSSTQNLLSSFKLREQKTPVFSYFLSSVADYFVPDMAGRLPFQAMKGELDKGEARITFTGCPVSPSDLVTAEEQPTAEERPEIGLPTGLNPFLELSFKLPRQLLPHHFFWLNSFLPHHIVHRIAQMELWQGLYGETRFLTFSEQGRYFWRFVLPFINAGTSARAVMELEQQISSAGGVFYRGQNNNFVFTLPFLGRDVYLQRQGTDLCFSDTANFPNLNLDLLTSFGLFIVRAAELSKYLLPELDGSVERLEFQAARDCFLRMRQKDAVFMRCPDGPVYTMQDGEFHCPLHGSPAKPIKTISQSYPELLRRFLGSFREMRLNVDWQSSQLVAQIDFSL